MGELGYKLKNYTMKDNESEILDSKQIAIKYFWVTNRIKNGDIKVVYCPTEEMLADFMSKPVQGTLFKNLRAVLMGWTHMNKLFQRYNKLVECIRNNVNDTQDDIGKVDKSVKSQASRIAKCKFSMYAETS